MMETAIKERAKPKAKATPHVVLMREQARFWAAATNFLRWIRRETARQQLERERRIWALITPRIATVGGMCAFVERNQTPLHVWRKALASQNFSA